MQWFQYGVGDAIKVCHQQQCLLVVFVSDEQEASVATLLELEDEEVTTVLYGQKFVALKIIKDSLEYKQFSQFYNIFFFPSIFCISFLGKTIVAMQGHQGAKNMKIKFVEAFEEVDKLTEERGIDVSNGDNGIKSAMTDVESAKSVDKLQCIEEEQTSLERLEQVNTNCGKEEKVKSWQSDRRKKKEVQHISGDPVKHELVKDIEQHAATESSHIKLRHRGCRVQLRLPLGSTKVLEMDSEDTLLILRKKVFELLSEQYDASTFSLISVYPRQELTQEMDGFSMKQLNLSPSGIVIVRSTTKSSQSSSFVWIAFMSIINFVMWCISASRSALSMLFWSPANSEPKRFEFEQEDQQKGVGIHKLHSNDDDSDEDEATYNGNSTQQQ